MIKEKRECMGKYKAILFDKDGTLIDFDQTWLQMWKRITLYLEQSYEVTKVQMSQIERSLGIVGNQIQDGIYLFGTMEQWVSVVSECIGIRQALLMNQMQELVSNYFKSLEHYPYIGDVQSALMTLKQSGYLLGLVTNDLEEHAYDFLEKSDLLSVFDFVAGDTLNEGLKPDPQSAIKFCEQFDLKPEHVVMVGDSYNDLLYAKNANLGLYLGIHQEGVESIRSIEEVVNYL